MKDRMEEFENECVDEGDAKRIDGVSKSKEVERFENQSDYHLKAAEELIGSEADLIAIVEGYYSMLHKSNQALALAGFKADTQMYITRIKRSISRIRISKIPPRIL